jgi:hypothetical protein
VKVDRARLRGEADRLLRRAVARLAGAEPVLVPDFPLRLDARWGWNGPVMAEVEARLAGGAQRYEAAVQDICALLDWARTIPRRPVRDRDPCWENDHWGTVDALMQCAALKRRDPALYLEVGSGFSTLFARRAIEDFGLRTRIVSIDPHPRAEVDACCDEVVRAPLETLGGELFNRVQPGDVVLFDASHVALMGTETTVFHLETVHRLPPGVLVGVDDIFLPWDYPPSWTGRIYGEQYLVAAHLLGGGAGWDVTFPGWWIVEGSPLAARFEPLWPVVENHFGRHATSFWFERV